MKRTIFITAFLILFPIVQYASDFNMGIFLGPRIMSDSDIKDVYGNGMVYYPFVEINVWEGVYIGGGYEGGYSKNGKIGLYSESTTLKVTGMELFIGYQFKIKMISPYINVGFGSFSYKQTIDSPYVGDYKVDNKKTTMTVCGGIKFYLIKNFFLAGEVKYIPLKVKPYEHEVDLSGLRCSGGIGYTFKF